MDDKTKVETRIFGNEYCIVGNESYEYIYKVCNDVDKKMREIAHSSRHKPMKISVLAAVNFCDEYHKAADKLKEAQMEISRLNDEIKILQQERSFLKSEIKSQRGKFKR